ncbi:hypothetical protein L7F22_066197 [Adiantum nelumboides]|nr:hypothetical protein [Adiantum nelumboides]
MTIFAEYLQKFMVERDLVLWYPRNLDTRKKSLAVGWYVIFRIYKRGSVKLKDLKRMLLPYRVNRGKLKKYHPRNLEFQEYSKGPPDEQERKLQEVPDPQEARGSQKNPEGQEGSNPGDNYSLSIFINTGSSLNPTCQCSCPAAPKAKGNLCKHVVALLLLRTKELAKVAKDQANAAVLVELKSAEERFFEARGNEPTLSDSQATEVFVPSDDNVDNDVSTTASSISPVMKNNQRSAAYLDFRWILCFKEGS